MAILKHTSALFQKKLVKSKKNEYWSDWCGQIGWLAEEADGADDQIANGEPLQNARNSQLRQLVGATNRIVDQPIQEEDAGPLHKQLFECGSKIHTYFCIHFGSELVFFRLEHIYWWLHYKKRIASSEFHF